MPCFMCEHRKRDRFFGFRGDAEFIGQAKLDSERGEFVAQYGQER